MLEFFKMEDKNSSAKYDGYNSKTLGNNYDHISQKVKDKITDNGGVMDVKAEKNGGQELKGVRAVFNSKESRDDFNAEIDKMKKQQKNTNKQSDKKEDDAPKAKTQAELDKENKSKKLNETRINEIITESINSYLSEALKSPKLRQIAQKHGGLGKGGHGESDNMAWTRGGWRDVPLSDITDDMLGDESDIDMNPYSEKSNNGIVFRDGSTLPFKTNQSALDISDDLHDSHKQLDRAHSKNHDGAKYFEPSTNGAYHARHMRDVLNHGYGTIKHGKEEAEKVKDAGYGARKYWDDYTRSGKEVVDRAKKHYQEFKKDGTFNDKTKRF